MNVTLQKIVFTGTCGAISRDGNTIKVACKFGPPVLDNQLPFFIKGTVCNHLCGTNQDGSFLISAGCTLLKANWKFTAQVGAVSPASFTINLTALARVVGAAPTYFENWFGGGVIEWGAGANIQRRYIATSTTPVGGALSITLHRNFNGTPNPGDAVVLYPGCDGTYQTCKAYDATNNPTGKFGNDINFFALPFMPVVNPTLAGQPNLGVRGTKK